jgi:protein involved in polysaccharide export with SLBB domain
MVRELRWGTDKFRHVLEIAMPLALFSAVLILSLCPQGIFNLGVPDWLGHMVAYGTLTMMAMRRLDGRAVDVGIAVFAIGVLIELAQGLTPDRSVSLDDLISNAVGIGAVVLHAMHRASVVFVGVFALAGCATMETPRNEAPVSETGGYQQTQRAIPEDEDYTRPVAASLTTCTPNREYDSVPLMPEAMGEPVISRGDLLRIVVGDDPLMSDDYEIERDGMVRLPRLDPIPAHGVEASALTRTIEAALVSQNLYRAAPSVGVRVIERASVRIQVSGAVFEPGTTEIAIRSAESRDPVRQAAIGDPTHARGLVTAIQSAAGLRPDADTQRVLLRRDGQTWRLDLRPAALSKPFHDPMLLAGDEIVVPSLGCFQPGLAKPTTVTRKGIKVHLSNLINPTRGNAQSAIDDDVREIKYGTKLLQALVRMNCVGGTGTTNADRFAVLISRNPATDRTEVIERRIEALVRRSDRDNHDPVLMPGDAIACYDSRVTNARDVAKSIIEVISPSSLLLGGL